MKNLFLFVLGFLIFFFPFEAQSYEIAETPSPDQEEVIKYLQGEDIYQGTLSWKGNQLSSKFNYDKTTKKERLIETH
tara:strand:- start:472 stop:702 length:231 start_codon:yes stop_codon:yes gene_type:complete